MVPAALGGEVVEAQPQHCVRTETQRAERRNVKTGNTLHGYISMVDRRRKDSACSGHRIQIKIGMFLHLNVIFVLLKKKQIYFIFTPAVESVCLCFFFKLVGILV